MLLTATAGRSTISIHFWNLAEYVGGNLVGDWVDLDECVDFEDFQRKVMEATKNAEELILGDYESEFGVDLGFGEYPNLDTVWELHTKLSEIDEDDRDAFADYLAYHGGVSYLESALSEWQDRYCGRWNSLEDYALDFASDVYSEFFKNVPPGFMVEVDTAAWECDHWISDNGHVFRCF
ncbi:hypothetical protein Ssi03_13100 [Sphaerisporangium siamense]|uniref:Antirestriction protein ArdA n=1 Tax=Sphaerisporangium siamense TaxID=795645 RepID=A0A7W7DC28_9ACTN|nr:antirestriction protein ArdA [Sphaerisporangium siamense]MBB4702921.1 hypothetical protein [Sphaerisporangium siamense]GII83320.1 hypothetical protein Ssi03_13100 [Sphaerisporangium siamense]